MTGAHVADGGGRAFQSMRTVILLTILAHAHFG
jgi:hypothetical protein